MRFELVALLLALFSLAPPCLLHASFSLARGDLFHAGRSTPSRLAALELEPPAERLLALVSQVQAAEGLSNQLCHGHETANSCKCTQGKLERLTVCKP